MFIDIVFYCKFRLKDGSLLEDVDALIFCTGYSVDLPFLSPECGIEVTCGDNVVVPLYHHVFHTKYTIKAISIYKNLTSYT